MRKNIELLKTVALFDDVAYHESIDTIDYGGTWWLVHDWLDCIDEKWSRPKRIVSLNSFDYRENDSGAAPDFFLNEIIPRSLFCDPIQKLSQHVVAIDNPDICVPLQIYDE